MTKGSSVTKDIIVTRSPNLYRDSSIDLVFESKCGNYRKQRVTASLHNVK
eukprot:CAMPEP_0197232536 /NCGR_PEP_ID=MMETSP1429-20130617/798_1 /TAXON_ID=49237 /ORGANISM="Chaetoceros  sp., Strain UNC1202" /LENGTH=49 /DNA_ID= /DNA_START= /DNA_END= /DNA_ORIENTATION=